MKINIYLKSLMILSLILMFSTLILAKEIELASPEQKNELYNSIDNYYLTFGAENMDDYLNTQYLNHLDSEELSAKKDLIQEMWDEYASGYSLSDRDNCVYFIDDSIAFVEYTLSTYLLDDDYNELNSFDMQMTAILFNIDNDWKIFNTIPTSVFEFNTVVDLFSDKDDLRDDDSISENFSKIAVDILRTPETVICDIDINLSFSEAYSLEDLSSVDLLIGNDKFIKVIIGDDIETYYHYMDNHITSVPFPDDIDFTVTMDSCTLQRLTQGASPQVEYEEGNIKFKGEGLGSSLKVVLGKVIFKIYSWFSDTPTFELWIEAETGELKSTGKYSFIGPTSRGPGELYLGDKNSFAKYKFNLEENKMIYLYARVNDDGLHKDGSRSVKFDIDGLSVDYEHKSRNYVINGDFWGWVYIGEFDLSSGEHTLTVNKSIQTSAAFIVDKFAFFDEKRDISSFN